MPRPVFDVDRLSTLRQPTVRVPMHISPDGSLLAVSSQSKRRQFLAMELEGVAHGGIPIEAIGSRVHVVNTATGDALEPFAKEETSWGAQWSPHGKLLAAYLAWSGTPVLAVWHLDSRRVQAFETARVRPLFGFDVPRWTPDSRCVVVKLVPSSATPHARVTGARPAPDLTPGVRVFSFDPEAQASGASKLPAVSERYRCDLGLVDVFTGEVRRLAVDWPLGGWKVAPDGNSVAVLKHVEISQNLKQFYFDLLVVSIDGSEPRVVAARLPQKPFGVCFNWSPDSRQIAYTTAERDQPARLFVAQADGSVPPVDLTAPGEDMDLSRDYEAPRWTAGGGRILCLGHDGYWEFAPDASYRRRVGSNLDLQIIGWVQRPTGSHVWTPAGDESLLLVTVDPATKNTGLTRVDVNSGESRLITAFPRRLQGPTFGAEAAADGSTIYLLLQASDHPPGVWRLTTGARDPELLFPLSPSMKDVALGASRLIEYRTLDGALRRAALLLPPNYIEGQQVPVIVQVYGGDDGSNALHVFGGDESVVNWQILAAQGYAVLYPDMRMKEGDPLQQLPGLVLPALDKLLELGITAPRQIGLMGHSYGGYCAVALLTLTTRFRAAVASAAAVNFTSFYGTLSDGGDSPWLGWLERGQPGMGGSMWEKREKYIENSPLFYLDRVETPLLLISGTRHHEEPAQAGEAFSALRRLGKRVEARLYEGEDHPPVMWSERSTRDLCGRIVQWFDEHLKNVPGS